MGITASRGALARLASKIVSDHKLRMRDSVIYPPSTPCACGKSIEHSGPVSLSLAHADHVGQEVASAIFSIYVCRECGEDRPGDERILNGMKCAQCAVYAVAATV